MKLKLSVTLLLILSLVSSSIAYANNSTDNLISEAELYEKTIEADISGDLEWRPVGVSDFETVNKDTKLGKSTSKNSSFRYFYDSEKEYLIQYFKVKSKRGVVVWDNKEVISYETFN